MGTLNTSERKALEQKLDETAVLWKTTPPENNQDAVQAYKAEIWLLVFKLYDWEDYSDRNYDPNALVKALEEAFTDYDPQKGQFSHYFSKRFSGRKKDFYDYTSRHAPGGDSLDRPATEDGKLTLGDMLPADKASQPEGALYLDGRLAELTSVVMDFLEKRDREHNDTRKLWYRIFYTEDMTLAMKTLELRFVHERDIFSAMDTAYLDYYMAAVCRTGQAVMNTPLKPYDQVVPGCGDTGPVPLPLPGDVSLSFLKICRNKPAGPSARSNQLGFYKALKDTLSPR